MVLFGVQRPQGEEQKSLYQAFVEELSQDGSVLPIPGEVGDVG